MTRIFTLLSLLLSVSLYGSADVTLDYCLSKAEKNYPDIKKYGLLDNSLELNLAEINRGWLPCIGVSAQGNVQNIVPVFPDVLQNMLAQNGYGLKGMNRLQYKIAAELNQTIWDGGNSKARRAVERASSAEAKATIDVELYAIRTQVESVFFGILLLQEQLRQTKSTICLLEANLQRLKSMVKYGTAMQSDADMVEAQCLTLKQSLSQAQSAMAGYRNVLAVFIAEDIADSKLICPEDVMPETMVSARPELTLFDRRIERNRASVDALNASMMPRVSFFAQAYYGYPGYNYFESMIKRNLSFNAMAGIRMSWNIEPLYTNKLKHRKLAIASEMVDADRETFLFNNRLLTSREEAEINGIREVMKEDARIVELRQNVRRAAESQLRNGIIDATALLAKINDENQAKLNSVYHKVQLIQSIYKLKNTLNR